MFGEIECFYRTCQSCGHVQKAKDPSTYKNSTSEKWREVCCRNCKSPDLDYGSYKPLVNK